MTASSRRPTPQGGTPAKSWRCSDCSWEKPAYTVGPYGRTSPKACIAQMLMAFNKHDCLKHPMETTSG